MHTFVFLDECIQSDINVCTLSALFVDENQLEMVLEDYYKLNRELQVKLYNSSINYMHPITLHGKCMLSKKGNKRHTFEEPDDDEKIKAFSEIVNIFNKHKLHYLRVGVTNYKEAIQYFRKDDKLYTHNWTQLFWSLINKPIKYTIVMDGHNSTMMHKMVQPLQSMRYVKYGFNYTNIITDIKIRNFPTNVLFSSLEYSEPLQIVDCISYLMSKIDRDSFNLKETEFNKRLLSVARTINMDLVQESISEFQLQSK